MVFTLIILIHIKSSIFVCVLFIMDGSVYNLYYTSTNGILIEIFSTVELTNESKNFKQF